MTFPYGSNVPSSSVPRPIPGDSSQKAPPSKGALQGRVITQNPSFGQLVARVALGFFVVMTAPISIPIIHCVMTALTKANLNKEGSHFERICMKIHNLMGFGPPVKEVWRELGDVVLRSCPGSKDSFNKAFEAAIEFSSNSTKENFQNLRGKLSELPDNVKRIISDNEILVTELIGSECVGRCSEKALVALDEALDTSSIAEFMKDNGFVAVADFSDSGIEGERTLEVSYKDRVALKEVFSTLCVIGGTNDPRVRQSFRDKLIDALGKLPEKVKEFLFKGNGLNRFFAQYFQDIGRLGGKPLEGEAICLERALYPKDMVIFLKRLLDHPEREAKIETLKSYAERVFGDQIDIPIPTVAREGLESLLGFELPADLTPRRLLNSLDYVKYATTTGLREAYKKAIEPGSDWDREDKAIKAHMAIGFGGEFPPLQDGYLSAQGDRVVQSYESSIQLMEERFVQDCVSRPDSTLLSVGGGDSFRNVDGIQAVAELKKQVKEFANKFNLSPQEKSDLEKVMLFCFTQFGFKIPSDHIGHYGVNILDNLDSAQYENELRIISKELKKKVDRQIFITRLENGNGFTVTSRFTVKHEAQLEGVGDDIVSSQDHERVRADLGVGPVAETVVTGSFDVIIDSTQIGRDFYEAFRIANSTASHETRMLR